jgi:hypothetical protein
MSGWVSQGAADAMAQWAEDWDIGTEWKDEGRSKVVADGRRSVMNWTRILMEGFPCFELGLSW